MLNIDYLCKLITFPTDLRQYVIGYTEQQYVSMKDDT